MKHRIGPALGAIRIWCVVTHADHERNLRETSLARLSRMAARLTVMVLALLLGACAANLPSGPGGQNPDSAELPAPPEQPPDKQLGKAFLAEALKQFRFVKDPEVTRLVNGIGRRLVAAAGSNPEGYHFFIVRESQLNAFAIPGGYIFIFDGLLAQVNSVEEMAGVLGHEVAHVQKNHFFKDQGKIRAMELATIAAILLGGPEAAVLAAGANLNLQLQFSRENEEEADAAAIIYLRRAGFPPQGLVGFFQTLASYERFNPPILPSYFSTHPGVQERVRTVSNLLRASHEDRPAGISGSSFEGINDWARTSIVLRTTSSPVERTHADMVRMVNKVLGEEAPEHRRRYLLGLAYLKMDRIAQAIPEYQEAIRLAPGEAEYLADLSYCYLRLRKIESARQAAEEAVDRSPDVFMAHLVLGMADAESGNLETAIGHYEQALRISADDLRIHWQLSQAYLKKEDALMGAYHVGRYLRLNLEPQKAVEQFKHALRLSEKGSQMSSKILKEIEEIQREGV